MSSSAYACIKLKVAPDDVSNARINNDGRVAFLLFWSLQSEINERVEPLAWKIIQRRRQQLGGKLSALIVFVNPDSSVGIERQFHLRREVPVSRKPQIARDVMRAKNARPPIWKYASDGSNRRMLQAFGIFYLVFDTERKGRQSRGVMSYV